MKNIIFVDNDPLMKITLEVSFGSIKNIQYVLFLTSEEALRYLEKNQVDLLVSDYNLGPEKGTVFIGFVKKLYPNIKTIILSGESATMLKSLSDLKITDAVMSKMNPREFKSKVFEILNI
jgi:DNA-binding NarL/FixJ family response regulator